VTALPIFILSDQQWFLETTTCGSSLGDRVHVTCPQSKHYGRYATIIAISPVNSLTDAGLLTHHHTGGGQHATSRHGETSIAELTRQHEVKTWTHHHIAVETGQHASVRLGRLQPSKHPRSLDPGFGDLIRLVATRSRDVQMMEANHLRFASAE
jgi:hypothetical protein